jgi:uncharacterized repeat protein (TIGR01451 family)
LTASDNVGVTVILDQTPPVIAPQMTGTLGNNGWYRSAVAVSWGATDPESGIASSTGCAPATVTADTAGVTLTCSAVNGAGLSSSVPVTIRIDKTPPTLTIPSNTFFAPRTSGMVVPYTVTAVDGLDPHPTVSCSPASGTTFVVGTTPVTCTATDAAGNSQSSTFNLVVVGPDDLTVGGLASPLIQTGKNLTYGLAVVNLGPSVANQVVLRDPLPVGTTFVSASWSAGTCAVGAAGVNCSTPSLGVPCVFNQGVVTCNIGTLAPFTLKQPTGAGVSIMTRVTAASGTTINNTVTVAGANVDSRPNNNTFVLPTRVVK